MKHRNPNLNCRLDLFNIAILEKCRGAELAILNPQSGTYLTWSGDTWERRMDHGIEPVKVEYVRPVTQPVVGQVVIASQTELNCWEDKQEEDVFYITGFVVEHNGTLFILEISDEPLADTYYDLAGNWYLYKPLVG